MTEKELRELAERAKISLGAYEELHNRLFDLHEQHDFNASEFMMIVAHLSASVIKAIQKNCFDKEAEEEVEKTFYRQVKSNLMLAKDKEKEAEPHDTTIN